MFECSDQTDLPLYGDWSDGPRLNVSESEESVGRLGVHYSIGKLCLNDFPLLL